MRSKDIEINGYIVTFEYDERKTKVRRKDNIKVDPNSKEFKNDIIEIKKTKEYIDNYKMFNLYTKKEASKFTQDDNESLLNFTKNLLREK